MISSYVDESLFDLTVKLGYKYAAALFEMKNCPDNLVYWRGQLLSALYRNLDLICNDEDLMSLHKLTNSWINPQIESFREFNRMDTLKRYNCSVFEKIGDLKLKQKILNFGFCEKVQYDYTAPIPYVENREFVDAFLSWTGERKRWRLENKFDYCYEDIVIKHDIKLFSLPAKIIKAAQNGEFNNREYGSFTKPLNKWKSEELVYNIAKKLYGEYQVAYIFFQICILQTMIVN